MNKDYLIMQDVLRTLEFELGEEAFEIFEWYCKTYRVSAGDPVPDTIRYEIFGE